MPMAFDLLCSEYLSALVKGSGVCEVSEKTVPNGLIDVSSSEPRQGIVKLGDESVSVILGHAHECPTHDDKLDLTGSRINVNQDKHARIPCPRCDPMLQAGQPSPLSVHKGRIGPELPSYSSVRSRCNSECCSRNLSQDHQDSI